MLELEGQLAQIYLLPGEVHLARKPAIIRTILGSCVGATFWSARLGMGALSHSLLPRCPANSAPGLSLAARRRYVDFAIRDLAQQFDELGAVRAEVQVKLFGGADVLLVTDPAARPTVGKLNCEMALEVVRAEGFNVMASSLGGTCGLNIKFNTSTGEVLLHRLPRVVLEEILDD
jgi:chemotaxis receptor (MCP) glutamine deamidase CheD